MRDVFLEMAGLLAVVVGVVHGILGETKVFARAQIEPPRLKLLLRAVWQCSAAAWIGGGLLLVVAPSLATDARRWIILVFVAVYAVGVVGNALAFRGRHYGWVLLGSVIALALAGI